MELRSLPPQGYLNRQTLPGGGVGDTTARSQFCTPPLPRTPGPARSKGAGRGGTGVTHRNHDRVFSLKLGDVLIAAVHLRLVERSEATHHFDVALGRVRHLSRCRGRRPGATPRRSVWKEAGPS